MEEKRLMLILNNIRSVHNVGSIFRTADAAGVTKIYCCGYTPIPERRGKKLGNDKLAKTALGAEKTISWEYAPQTWRLIQKLKGEGIRAVALEQSKRSIDYRKYSPQFPMVIIVGNEVRGVSRKILTMCDDAIEIPMRGKKESLNVSVAAGVILYKLNE
jgi:23S rRNA (guanosine2251-2'-O)-methyltransferase